MNYIVDFESFLDRFGDAISEEFNLLGMDGEMDSSIEDFEEKQYEEYCKRIGKWSNIS